MKRGFIFIVLTLLAPLLITSEESRVIRAACDPWAPFVEPDMPGKGISIEIVSAAFATQGYTLEYANIPWARAEAGVKSGKYDILPDVWYTTARDEYLLFSEPYARNTVRFISRKDNPFDFKGMASLRGKKIGTIRYYSYSEEFSRGTDFTREEVADLMQNINKLLAKRIDMTLEDEIVANFTIAQNNPAILDELYFSETPLSIQNLYIATADNNPRAGEIIYAFNKGLKAIRDNGEVNRILDSYIK
ncbi:MAG: transporter substrate-binding domain-containing protein [Spirochaetales bacterium]|nr:transporter substrate-binding domain-containing protein [Spirochaetales bacterium]